MQNFPRFLLPYLLTDLFIKALEELLIKPLEAPLEQLIAPVT